MIDVSVLKNDEEELSIPTQWRPIFKEIVKAFVNKDYSLTNEVEFVAKVSEDTSNQIKEYIEDYGEELTLLPDETWESSFYMWQGDYWDVIIDLWTKGEGRSDLILRANVFEDNQKYRVEIYMVYVM
jgi:hypothetical protein